MRNLDYESAICKLDYILENVSDLDENDNYDETFENLINNLFRIYYQGDDEYIDNLISCFEPIQIINIVISNIESKGEKSTVVGGSSINNLYEYLINKK